MIAADLPTRLGDRTADALVWKGIEIAYNGGPTWNDISVAVPHRKCKIVAKRTATCQWTLTVRDDDGTIVYHDAGTSRYKRAKFTLDLPAKRRGVKS